MMNMSTKTVIIMSLFITAASLAGCADESDGMLIDNDGNPYQIVDNEDGTKTAKYENGDHVTFRESEDGGLDFVDGTAMLLGGMALSYMASQYGSTHNGAYGYYDSGSKRFVPSQEIRERKEQAAHTGAGYIHTNTSKSTSSNVGGKVDLSKPTSSAPKVSSGFGGAGARSGGSAVS